MVMAWGSIASFSWAGRRNRSDASRFDRLGTDQLGRLVLNQRLALVAVLVPDYDSGIAFFVDVLGFALREDTKIDAEKRWVRVAPSGGGTEFLLARAVGPQTDFIGKQGGGRVWLFLETDDFAADYTRLKAKGVTFNETPREEPYGTVAVFTDPFGNRWDLIQFKK